MLPLINVLYIGTNEEAKGILGKDYLVEQVSPDMGGMLVLVAYYNDWGVVIVEQSDGALELVQDIRRVSSAPIVYLLCCHGDEAEAETVAALLISGADRVVPQSRMQEVIAYVSAATARSRRQR